jgi:copper(I)-binding protein
MYTVQQRPAGRLLPVMAVLMAVLFTGCKGSQPRLAIENVHAEYSPAMRDEAAVYLTIRNEGGKDTLTGARIDIPGALAGIHEMRGGMMIITNALKIPAKSTIELGPMGSHIMLNNMPGAVKEGSRFTLTLVFARSGEIRVPVEFVKPRS